MPSFDIVSSIDHHELTNAIDQCTREIENRFDFKGTSAKISQENKSITLFGDNDFQLDQLKEILTAKCGKRGIHPQSLEYKDPEKHHANVKQTITVLEGIDSDFGKKITKFIKDRKLKVQASIQQEQVRVTGKKRDDLQAVMQALKEHNWQQPLQFQNFRD